ncbi:MAG: hypothetical protein K8R87_01915 [Verrucomicrobia bacterium]|nr:hypothetical protein [Verrucomicrobiota bacterium]
MAANGSYNFGTVAPNTSYSVVLSTTQGTVGSAAPAAALPSSWVNTGENIGTGAGDDGSINGSLAVSVVISGVANANFGIEQKPTAFDINAGAQLNPGGSITVEVPTLTGTDPEDSSVTSFIIKTLPSNGTLYYDGVAVTAGQTITSYDSTKLTVDPADGVITVSFTYAAVDLAGKESPAKTVTMPFTDPLAHPIGSCYNSLQQMAFALDPTTAILPTGDPFQVVKVADLSKPSGYRVDAKVRELPGSADIIFTVEYIASLASSGANGAGWSSLATPPTSTASNGDGSITATYQDLETLTGLSSGQGFVRMKVTYGAVSTRTKVSGWSRRTALQNICQTVSMPYISYDLFCGKVDSATGASINLTTPVGSGDLKAAMLATGKSYCLEVTGGSYAGQRFAVDISASTATTLALDATSPLNTTSPIPALAPGDYVKLHPFWTLDELFDKNAFSGSNDPLTADRVTFYDNPTQTFKVYWLLDFSSIRQWVAEGDATLTDAGGRLMDPAEGCFLTARSADTSQIFIGFVRDFPFASPLKSGFNLIGGGWPMDQSSVSRGMTTALGFTGNGNPALADKVQIWKTDVTGLTSDGYSPYYLL